jgi:two-component system alkaline phosphatase synthesis response regulator PhoP
MQEQDQHNALSESVVPQDLSAPLLDLVDGAFCEITNRILIISPRPASLRALVAELAIRCYDVLLLHHADEALLSMVQGNIIVVDRTVDSPAIIPAVLSSDGSSPVLALVKDKEAVTAQDEEWVKWPGPVEHVISKILLLAAKYPAPVEDTRTLVFKELALDPGRMLVTQNGMRIDLTKTEFDLLKAIIVANGNVLSRQELMTGVWGEQYYGGSNAVDVHIRSLRQKLNDNPKNPSYIATVRGAGYRLADV